MKNFKIIVIIFLALAFSGCDFFSNEKKVEMAFPENTEKYIEETEGVETKDDLKEDDSEKTKESQEKGEVEKDSIVVEEEKKEEIKLEEEESQNEKKSIKIIDKLVSWGFTKTDDRKIDTIIIHSSYNAVGKDVHDLDDIIYKEYKPYGVSPHYIISWEGKIYRLVKDKDIAYHAGESKVPDGRKNVNNFSIGIEIVNTKQEKPNSSQYQALKNLVENLKERYKIKYILGHDDIAPGRKDDPWNFDVSKLK